MIGVFDSGLGGLVSLRYFTRHVRGYDFLFLADQAHVPYGEKDPKWIEQRVHTCAEWMFDQGCKLVILACNSASAYAIRSWQAIHPDQKMLSVTIPGVEAIVEDGYHRVGILGTQATIKSKLYESVFAKHFPTYSIEIQEFTGTGLVDLLEAGASKELLSQACKDILLDWDGRNEALVLGCTHYPLLTAELEQIFPGLPLVDPSLIASTQIESYLGRHQEIDVDLSKKGNIRFLTTGDPVVLEERGLSIWGDTFMAERVEI